MRVPQPALRLAGLVVLLIVAAAAQCVWAFSIRVHGARPDFILVAALLCSQFSSANQGAAIGFGSGMLSASICGPPEGGFGSIVVSRCLVCFCIGWLEERMFRDNAAIAMAIVAAGTAFAEGLFYAFDPHFPVVAWSRNVASELAYNLVLTIPMYLVVRLVVRVRKPVAAASKSA